MTCHPSPRTVRVTLALSFIWLLAAGTASAQLTRVGDTFPVGPSSGAMFTDASFDPVNNAYLVVWRESGVKGIFVSPDGAPLGSPFALAQTAAFTDCPSAVYGAGANGFLVTWLDGRTYGDKGTVWGRLLRYGPGGVPVFMTGDFEISPNFIRSTTPPRIAYSKQSQDFLVTLSNGDVRARIVSATGALVTPADIVIQPGNVWSDFPDVAYGWADDEFLVVYQLYDNSNAAYLVGRRLAAATGAFLDAAPIVFDGPATSVILAMAQAQYDPRNSRYLVTWFRGSPSGEYGRLLTLTGPSSNPVPVAGDRFTVALGYGSYDSNALRRSPYDGTYLTAFYCSSGYEDCGTRVSPAGAVDPIIQLTNVVNRPRDVGNFYGRLAANTLRADWLIAFSMNFLAPYAQLLRSIGGDPGNGDPPDTPASPTVTGVVPNTGRRPGGTTVTISGTNFIAGATSVAFGAAAATSVNVTSATQLTAVTPAGNGSVTVTVTTSSGSGSLAGGFTYVGSPTGVATVIDFNGDGATDVTVFRPSTGEWYRLGQAPFRWGALGDVPVPGDYDGNLIAEEAVYRPGTGTWYIRNQTPVRWGALGDVPVPGDYDGNGTTDIAVYRPRTGIWDIRNAAGYIQWGMPGDIPVPGDYDGDRVTDVAVYRPSTGTWFIRNLGQLVWGQAGDIPVPADYNGDGVTDIAVYRPSTGTWYVHGLVELQWGRPGDVPVPGDYNGDGTTDIAVYRPSTGEWYVRNLFVVVWGSPADLPLPRPPAIPTPVVFGNLDADPPADLGVYRPSTGTWWVEGNSPVAWGASGDLPVPGDYNGDGIPELTLFRPSDGTWYMPGQSPVPWGVSGDYPVPGDYDGYGTTDIAAYRPSTGTWYVRNQFVVVWGAAGDIPVQGDYNGDGATEVAVYRPSTGTWFIWCQPPVQWGEPGDIPVPADYNGDGVTDIAVYRPSTGTWFILNQGTVQWGEPGDLPVPADFDGVPGAEIAVYRPATGVWWVRNLFARQWGAPGDIPAFHPGYYYLPQ